MNEKELAVEAAKKTFNHGCIGNDCDLCLGIEAGVDAGYDAGRSQWVAINSVDDLPKDYTPAGYFVMPSIGSAEIWYRKPDVPENTDEWLTAKAWMPIPPYRTPEAKQS